MWCWKKYSPNCGDKMSNDASYLYMHLKGIKDGLIAEESYGDELKFTCPRCGHNSASYNVVKKVGHCLRNQNGLCTLKTIKIHSYDDHTMLNKLIPGKSQNHQRTGSNSEVVSPEKLDPRKLTSVSLRYLNSRGINQSTINYFRNIYEVNHAERIWLAWPTIENFYHLRSTSNRYKKIPKGHKQNISIFGPIGSSTSIVVTEGIFDGLSYHQIHSQIKPIHLILNSVNNRGKFENYALGLKRLGVTKFILALDNGEAGFKATKDLKTFCQQNDLDYAIHTVPPSFNDWNDVLLGEPF
jgi:hypothetical protein